LSGTRKQASTGSKAIVAFAIQQWWWHFGSRVIEVAAWNFACFPIMKTLPRFLQVSTVPTDTWPWWLYSSADSQSVSCSKKSRGVAA
jgi:hypothetical protein